MPGVSVSPGKELRDQNIDATQNSLPIVLRVLVVAIVVRLLDSRLAAQNPVSDGLARAAPRPRGRAHTSRSVADSIASFYTVPQAQGDID